MPVLAELLRKTNNKGHLFTGEPNLDDALASTYQSPSPPFSASQDSDSKVGIPQHTFTELSGPVSSGRTAIWLALVTEILRRGMNVLYISCKQRPFPFRRAQELKNWNSGRFETRVSQIYTQCFEEFLLLDTDWSRFGLVVIDQYDALIRGFQDRAMRERACCSLLEKASDIAKYSSVFSTSGCMKYRNEEGTTILAPLTLNVAKQTSMTRLMCYKDTDGKCVLSTGTKFSVQKEGLVSETPCIAASVPLHSLASTRRFTPHRHKSSSVPLTPTLTRPKRRASISTPSRPDSSGPDPYSQGTPVKRRQHMQPLSFPSSDHGLFQQGMGTTRSSIGTSVPASDRTEDPSTSHPNSQYGDLIDPLTPNVSYEVESKNQKQNQNPVSENILDSSIPNSQVDPADPVYKLNRLL